MTASSETQAFVQSLVGRKLTSLERHECSWSFAFENIATLVIEGPWRILSAGHISVSDGDDGQKFGHAEPVDARARASQSILGKRVSHVAIRKGTGDLAVSFGEDLALEALNVSSGYEAWQLSKPQSGTLISAGGGRVVLA